MNEPNLQELFPNMRPTSGAPAQFTINGFGLMLYGARDRDPILNSYVTSHCLTALFFPVIFIGAYRVVHSQGGKFIIGKEPLSWLARGWNLLTLGGVPTAIVAMILVGHYNSADYIDGQKMAEARQASESGEYEQAAKLYEEVAQGESIHGYEAVEAIGAMVDGPLLKASPKQGLGVLRIMARMEERSGERFDLPAAAIKLAAAHKLRDPKATLEMINVAAALTDDESPLDVLRRPLLDRIVADDPGDLEATVQLAVFYEQDEDDEKCESLLTPFQGRLGSTEGARILGGLLSRKGELEAGQKLLRAYVDARLESLNSANRELESTVKEFQTRCIDELDNGGGPTDFYEEYEAAASDVEKTAILNRYLENALKGDPDYSRAQIRVMKLSPVVPVALELGTVMIERARELPENERRALLTEAEKIFLEIKSFAGEAQAYKLSLGRVYYWMGRQEEGQAQFNEALENGFRDFVVLMQVAGIYRDLGDSTKARELLEEAYAKTDDDAEKHQAASLRALTQKDLDDRIAWLRLCDDSDRRIKINLETSLAEKAAQEGKDEEAIAALRRVVQFYEEMPEDVATLNNGGLVLLQLHGLTHEPEHFDRGLAMLEKALKLAQSDGIVATNAARFAYQAAVRSFFQSQGIDLQALELPAHLGFTVFLYLDDNERLTVQEALRNDRGLQRARRMLEKAIILAPKTAATYQLLASALDELDDADALARLEQTILQAVPDAPDAGEESNGEEEDEDEKTKTQLVKQAEKLRANLQKINDDPTTAAMGVVVLQQFEISLHEYGVACDADALVERSRQTLKNAPSRGSFGGLINSLLFRAAQRLTKDSAEFKAFSERHKDDFSTLYLLTLAAEKNAKIKSTVVADADVKEAVSLIEEYANPSPTFAGVAYWALLNQCKPEAARATARQLLARKDLLPSYGVQRLLSPKQAQTIAGEYWLLKLHGRDDDAKSLVEAAVKRGASVRVLLD